MWNNIFEVLKEVKYQLKVICPTIASFRKKEEIQNLLSIDPRLHWEMSRERSWNRKEMMKGIQEHPEGRKNNRKNRNEIERLSFPSEAL
jgi:uncharacterized protein YllA (UPF0747 family)